MKSSVPGYNRYRQFAKRNARLSELSRRVIIAAEQMASAFEHPGAGMGHLLWVLLLEERSPVSSLLREAGLSEDGLQAFLEAGHPLFGVTIEPLLERGLEEAERLGSHYTGTEHLLLTLAGDEQGEMLLRQLAIDPVQLGARIREQLS